MPTAKGKAAQPAQQDDMQEGDELEIITTACEWMYEFCARNDMTHAMTGIIKSLESQFNCSSDMLLESTDPVMATQRLINDSQFEKALENLELVHRLMPGLDTTAGSKHAEVVRLVKVQICFKHLSSQQQFKEALDNVFPAKPSSRGAEEDAIHQFNMIIRKDLLSVATGKFTQAQHQHLQDMYPLRALLGHFASFVRECRAIMEPTKMDRILSDVRSGAYNLKSAHKPNKAPMTQGRKAAAEKAQEQQPIQERFARPSGIDHRELEPAQKASKAPNPEVAKDRSRSSSPSKVPKAALAKRKVAAPAAQSRKRNLEGVSAWDLRHSLETFGEKGADWLGIHTGTNPEVVAWQNRASAKCGADGDMEDDYDEASQAGAEEKEEEEEEAKPVVKKQRAAGKENVNTASSGSKSKDATEVQRSLADARSNMVSAGDDPLQACIKAAASATGGGASKAVLQTTGGKAETWASDDNDDDDDDDDDDDGHHHLPALGAWKPKPKLRTSIGGGKPGKRGASSSSRSRWSTEEEEQLIKGVSRYGCGAWQTILEQFTFEAGRTTVNLKDKWRNLQKAGKVGDDAPAGSAAARA